jgi:hypothetical protein
MKRHFPIVLLAVIVFLSIGASAQYGRQRPRDGACFYSDINFRGNMICIGAGQQADSLGDMDDIIRSIEIIGNVEATVFNDRDFRGENITVRRSVNDLRTIPLASTPGKNWHTRISSIRVSPARGGERRDDRDHDRGDVRMRDDHDWHREDRGGPSTVQCGAGMRERQFCETGGPVVEVRLMRGAGERPCEWGVSFGLDRGRLWTARGCGGTFEVR